MKNGKKIFTDFEKNLFKTDTRPVSCWTSYMFLSKLIVSRDWIWFGLASIPCLVTRKSRNFPDDTPKMHFEGLSIIQNFCRISNVSSKWVTWLATLRHLTSMSSMYTSIIFSIISLNILLTNLWYVAVVFFTSKGMTL